VALNPATPPSVIEYVLDDIDYVLLMSVNPGFSGQQFIPAARRKLEALSRLIGASGRKVRVTVDGSVVPENIADLAGLGADDFVTGAPLFGHRPLSDRVKEYREALA
jgi:ribulose-phosphate 3-epimerase